MEWDDGIDNLHITTKLKQSLWHGLISHRNEASSSSFQIGEPRTKDHGTDAKQMHGYIGDRGFTNIYNKYGGSWGKPTIKWG